MTKYHFSIILWADNVPVQMRQGWYKDLEEAKEDGRELWRKYQGKKELIIKENSIIIFKICSKH
jgi:hypothetical protein